MQLSNATRAAAVTRPVIRALAPIRPVGLASRGARGVVRASSGGSGVDADELQAKATAFAKETASTLQEKWEKTEDKPGAIIVISGTIIAFSLAFSLVNAIDKIPVVSDLIELVGLGVTGWFTYRYLTVGPDRDELFISIKEFLTKIYGKF